MKKANGRIAYRFHARDLHLVMGSAALGTPVRFRVLIDGKPPGVPAELTSTTKATVRFASSGYSTDPAAKAHRRSTIRDRVFRSGVKAFAFTFG